MKRKRYFEGCGCVEQPMTEKEYERLQKSKCYRCLEWNGDFCRRPYCVRDGGEMGGKEDDAKTTGVR